jgi:hypothetical protein
VPAGQGPGPDSERLHLIVWNDSEPPIDVLGVIAERRDTMINTIRRVLRRLDDWTLEVFNPRYPSDHR